MKSTENGEIKFLDNRGRCVIKIGENGKIGVARFPDLPDEFKDYLVESAEMLTDIDTKNLRDFLDFKTDENEFCS